MNRAKFDYIIKTESDLLKKEGIGTLSEKRLHRVLKRYFCDEYSLMEVKVNKFYADIKKGNQIIEIQTHAFNKLRAKLDYFLNYYDVTIILPIPHIKYISYLNDSTLQANMRKSPKCGTIYDGIKELYKIKMHLNNPRLHLKLMLLDVIDYRLKDNTSRKKYTNYERIPTNIHSILEINTISDYLKFLPETIENEFSNQQLAKEIKHPVAYAQILTNILSFIGVIKKVGKDGNKIIYSINK